MTVFLLAAALFLLLNVMAGLLRIARGPTAPDRMLAVQLFGTTGVAILLVLAEALQQRGLRDVALVFALLAAVLAVTFVKRGWPGTDAATETRRDAATETRRDAATAASPGGAAESGRDAAERTGRRDA